MVTAIDAKQAPMHNGFIKPSWGLTWAIPEGVTLAWGARAIYSWREGREYALTPTGRQKLHKGKPVWQVYYRPVIDLIHDRMSWSSLTGDHPLHGQDRAEEIRAMGAWIDNTGLPEIGRICRTRDITVECDGPEALASHSSDGYAIAANPNGSHGYLYIAAWKVP